jgi:hypothetical protein
MNKAMVNRVIPSLPLRLPCARPLGVQEGEGFVSPFNVSAIGVDAVIVSLEVVCDI